MAAVNFKTLSEDEVIGFLDSIDTILTDCDGVLWMYMNPLPNAAEVINTFQSFAIAKELEEVGISYVGVGPDPINKNIPYNTFNKDPEIGAVIVGFDEHFSYPKMVKAASYLSEPNVHFIATNTDERFPVANNVVIPGTGSLVRCIESCAERKAIVMGKPENILLGTRCGFKTLLVLTGITCLKDIDRWKQSDCEQTKEFIPDYYIESLGNLLPYLEKFKRKYVMSK
ncbi:Phosphoglycolate phosphatase [Melipona quadrifasciata]|uniref:Phosphoglycolate phosphatase n=1 Tax=Melipona quadrifasciata TaxID=166423 RepID=A0A0N0U7L6_9HYME|nr:Phosphoglycolate phosphatase [Melipona quadrifasciata]